MSKGLKYDDNKPRLDLIPPSVLFALGEVFAYGAEKYENRNWEKGIEYSRLYAGIQRHLWKWWNNQEIDSESGLNHLKHALTGLAMLFEMKNIHPDQDDRPKNNPKSYDEVRNYVNDSNIQWHPTTNGHIKIEQQEKGS